MLNNAFEVSKWLVYLVLPVIVIIVFGYWLTKRKIYTLSLFFITIIMSLAAIRYTYISHDIFRLIISIMWFAFGVSIIFRKNLLRVQRNDYKYIDFACLIILFLMYLISLFWVTNN
jgi:hypothetical protein